MKTKILVVDDEVDVLELMEELFDSRGYQSFTATNGVEALKIVREEEPDMIISDIRMPDMDGLTLLKEIKKVHPDTQVVVITAFATVESAVEAMKAGAYDYLIKPVNLEQLMLILKKIEDSQHLLAENRYLKRKLEAVEDFPQMIGVSQSFKEVLSEIETEISHEDLVVVELNEVYGRHAGFLNQIWSLIMFLPLFSLATATLCLLSYLMLSISGQQREFGIMRALGTKPGSIMKIVLSQALLITLIGGAIGVSGGLFVTFALLIPEPVASQNTFVFVAGWLLLALSLLCLSSLYPAVKAMKKSVVGALHSV